MKYLASSRPESSCLVRQVPLQMITQEVGLQRRHRGSHTSAECASAQQGAGEPVQLVAAHQGPLFTVAHLLPILVFTNVLFAARGADERSE